MYTFVLFQDVIKTNEPSAVAARDDATGTHRSKSYEKKKKINEEEEEGGSNGKELRRNLGRWFRRPRTLPLFTRRRVTQAAIATEAVQSDGEQRDSLFT